MSGRPRTGIGTYGTIHVSRKRSRTYVARTRYRDIDDRLRDVTATAASRNRAIADLKNRLLRRPGYGQAGVLSLRSSFGELAELWLGDLEGRDISEGTKQNYRDDLRIHVRPFFEGYTLGEITTGRVETFLEHRLRSPTPGPSTPERCSTSSSATPCATTRSAEIQSKALRR